MNETRDLLERVGERFTFPDDMFERLERRRDRKRRNKRIAAGVVGIAVIVAAVWIVTSGLSLDRSEKSVAPAGEVTGPAETAPAPPLASGAPDVVNRGPCRFGFEQPGEARSWLELTDLGDRIKVRFEVFRSPVGHSWRIVLRHDHTNIPVPDPDSYSPDAVVFFRGTRVVAEDGEVVVQGSVWDVAGSGFDGLFAEATDRQTELVCKAFAYIG